MLGGRQDSTGGSCGGTYPMNMKRKQAVVISAPRLEGDSIPSIATTAEGTGQGTAALRDMCCSSSRTGACPICSPQLPAVPAQPDFLHSIMYPQPPAPAREEGTALISATDHASASASPGMGAGAAQQARHTCAKVPQPTIS